ncbi:MAG: transcriptional repressor [Deltaproteobacteria bacterium]|jgi:Fur family peroxide stress response transcriptional regulator|nr:transcriptional repressor [Deltaproteobacteria bacterium]
MKYYKKILQDYGVVASLQRIKILEYLDKNRIHPTADDIYQALADEMPTLSKATIYNTLKAFVAKNLLIALSLFENEIRYEYNKKPHIHLKCVKCGKIFDIHYNKAFLNKENLDGHKILEQHLNLKGICKNCREG